MSDGGRPDAKLAFHEIPVGADLGSIDYEVDEKLVRRHLQATHQSSYPAQEGRQLVPASILASDGIRLAEAQFSSIGDPAWFALFLRQRRQVDLPPALLDHPPSDRVERYRIG